MNDQNTAASVSRLLTPEQVAEYLGGKFTPQSVTRGSLRRELPWVKIGRKRFMHPADLERFITQAREKMHVDHGGTPLEPEL